MRHNVQINICVTERKRKTSIYIIRLAFGEEGGRISTYPDAKESACQTAQQDAPDAAVFSKQGLEKWVKPWQGDSYETSLYQTITHLGVTPKSLPFWQKRFFSVNYTVKSNNDTLILWERFARQTEGQDKKTWLVRNRRHEKYKKCRQYKYAVEGEHIFQARFKNYG